MPEDLVHLRENSPELESFLNEHRVKFHGHCLLALKLMYSGVRLTDAKAISEYGISGRRLRELYNELPNVVKKAWVKDANGKRKYVEYFVEQPITPTKAKAIEWATGFLDKFNKGNFKQGALL